MARMPSAAHLSRDTLRALLLMLGLMVGCTNHGRMPPRTTPVGQTHVNGASSADAEHKDTLPEGPSPGPLVSRSPSVQHVVPPPTWARGFLVYERETIIRRAPTDQSERVGTTHAQVVLPFKARHLGPGCPSAWIELAPFGYVCGDDGEFTRERPRGAPAAPSAPIPFEYAFVAVDGARAFADVRYWGMDEYAEAYGEGFALRITGYTTYDGVQFARLRNGLFMEAAMLRAARPSEFEGHLFEPPRANAASRGEIVGGWVKPARAAIRDRVGGAIIGRLPARTFVTVRERAGRVVHVTLSDGEVGVIDAKDVHLIRTAPRPGDVHSDEIWIDVDLEQQVLALFKGDALLFATLVSTGRPTAQSRTPTGTFRIWVKLDFSDMDDLERIDVESNYAMQDVPWVQFFEKGHGLHAVYWHDNFGEPRSHGCVNLAPKDAHRLFQMTRPALPMGWHAILPNDEHPGTVVRVR